MSKRTRPFQRESVWDAACSSSEQDDTSPKKKKGPVLSSGAPVKVQSENCCMDTLPGELLTRIFGFLEMEDKAAVARVSRRWRDLVNHPSLWRDVHARLPLNSLDAVAFDCLQTRGIRQVTVLDRCKPNRLQQLVTTLSDVETLSVEKCLLSNQQLKSIFTERTLPHLKRLHLKCKKLKCISISSALERLDGVRYLELQGSSQRNFFSIMRVLKNVQHFTAKFKSGRLTEAPKVSGPMPCLTKLVLRRVRLRASDLLYLNQAFPNLEKLDVSLDARTIIPSTWQLAGVTQLRRFHLHMLRCGFSWMNSLRKALTDVQVIEVDSEYIDFEGLMTLTEIPSLNDLTVRTLSLAKEEYKSLLEACGRLSRLALHVRAADEPPETLRVLPHLTEVCLDSNWKLRDGHVQILSYALPSLTKLVLKKVSCLTNDSLKYVAHVATLKSLVVSGNDDISSRGLKYLKG